MAAPDPVFGSDAYVALPILEQIRIMRHLVEDERNWLVTDPEMEEDAAEETEYLGGYIDNLREQVEILREQVKRQRMAHDAIRERAGLNHSWDADVRT